MAFLYDKKLYSSGKKEYNEIEIQILLQADKFTETDDMLQILDEKTARTPENIEKEYKNCKYIITDYGDLQNPNGFLYCVSSSSDSFDEITRKMYEMTKTGIQCMLLGSYNNGGAVGVQYEVS